MHPHKCHRKLERKRNMCAFQIKWDLLFHTNGVRVESETLETHIVTICGQTEDLVSTLICHKCEKRFVIVAQMLKTRWLLFHALMYVIYIHGVLGQDGWGWGSWGGGVVGVKSNPKSGLKEQLHMLRNI